MGVPVRRVAGPSRYRERPAGPGPVRCVWIGNGGWDRRLRVLPDGCLDLVWTGSELHAAVPNANPVRFPVAAGAIHLGVRLRPGLVASVLGESPRGMPASLRLCEVWGAAADHAEWRLATAEDVAGTLCALVSERLTGVDALVLGAARLLGTVGPAATAARLGTSERTLRRRCVEQLGLGPKQLHRILRFQAFLAATERGERLADAAALAGYADQAHLARECAELAAARPGELAGRPWIRRAGRNIQDRSRGAGEHGLYDVHRADSGA
ncbi:helix-turn-helix domain-containing protein [Sciscionella marina]|uniref:helix-turn-helix domain-containing protein n=1 Tax=Sciscionella marina TaxID=508770 RepID=UPI000382442C|nr:helix-turn-helix domain-containing protein [Sciscionella marina]